MKRTSLLLLTLIIVAPAAQSTLAQRSNDPEAYYNRGLEHYKAGRYTDAVDAYNHAIKLRMDFAEAYQGLGLAYHLLGEYKQAIDAYKQAIKLKPDSIRVYRLLGLVYVQLFQYEEAIESLNQTIRRDPRFDEAIYNRGFIYLILARGELAAADAQSFLHRKGWRDRRSQDMVLVTHIGYRQTGRNLDAGNILDEAKKRCDTSAWPYPIIKYLRREITAQDLLAAASTPGKIVDAQAYVGLDLSLSARHDEALLHLRWVKDNGSKSGVEYRLALAEIQRLEANAPQSGPTLR